MKPFKPAIHLVVVVEIFIFNSTLFLIQGPQEKEGGDLAGKKERKGDSKRTKKRGEGKKISSLLLFHVKSVVSSKIKAATIAVFY